MKLTNRSVLKLVLLSAAAGSLFLLAGVKPAAQTQSELPARLAHVNDFAITLDPQTKERLENVLANVQQRSGIQFDLAVVQSTGGQDIFEFSRQLARQWDVGARATRKKSLLLVVAVDEKTAFTQFSRSVQPDLPEGALGEMALRLREHIGRPSYTRSLNESIQAFVNLLARKLAFSSDGLDQPATAANLVNPEPAPQMTPAVAKVEETPAPTKASLEESTPASSSSTRARRVNNPLPLPAETVSVAKPEPTAVNTTTEDEDEAEEVELTLTLPLEERVAKLKELLATYPNSKAKPRAQELLVSAHAALGDQRLKNGDSAGGVEQLMLAIDEAPTDTSDKLFSGVISQIPLNLYLRGERAAAFQAAQKIEARFNNNAKWLLAIAGFYLGVENGDEAVRVARQAITLAPEMAEAHHALAFGLHMSLRLDEAIAEYRRALELDPEAKATRRGLADLYRATGNAEQALPLYRAQLIADAKDKPARAGLVLSLFELKDEAAERELAFAMQDDSRNLALLTGAAYWFAAHNNPDRALDMAQQAVQVQPKYTWAQIALARALVAQRRPLEAERAIRFARQYGKFPTLDYELASVLAAAGLFDEAAEVLQQSFTFNNGEIGARLAGRLPVHGTSFIELLAPERRAGIFQFAAADDQASADSLKALLAFTVASTATSDSEKIDESTAVTAAKEFAAGSDRMKVYRQLYAATRLLRLGVGFATANELASSARSGIDEALDVPAVTVAVQAEELRDIRARAIASGGTPNIADAPRSVLADILRGRSEDISGWALFNQDRPEEAIVHLQRAANVLPEGTPSWRTAVWHLGAALEQTGARTEALDNYIRSYNAGEPDLVRRGIIEQLYRKVNGSIDGLELRIGASSSTAMSSASGQNISQPSPESTPATNETSASSPTRTTNNSATATGESPAAAASPQTAPSETPNPNAVNSETPAPSPAETPTPAPPEIQTTPTRPSAEPSLADLPARLRSTGKISGRVRDAANNGLASVVVVLISPRGTVIATTTDAEGNYSFTLSPSRQSYRVIPSRDGFAFDPLDRVLVVLNEDLTDVDFIGTARAP